MSKMRFTTSNGITRETASRRRFAVVDAASGKILLLTDNLAGAFSLAITTDGMAGTEVINLVTGTPEIHPSPLFQK